jgi:LysR family transcriptional regulator, glycine cleavage system transcriptional activator
MRRRLPKLSTLEAFRIAAAEGSFKAAAEVLSLTPSAISHQIKALEADLGTPLFERHVRQLVLTPAGRAFAEVIDAAFAQIAEGVQALRDTRARQTLALTLGSFVADEWVLPSLADFAKAHPEIDLRIDTSTRSRDLMREETDIALRFGRGQSAGLTAVHLLNVYATPVIGPALFSGQSDWESLGRLPRLQSTAVPDAWQQWEQTMGLRLPPPASEIWLDSYLALLQAASRGLGVALGLQPLIDGWVQAGRLLTPWPSTPRPAAGYYVVYRPADETRPAVVALREWLRRVLPTSQVNSTHLSKAKSSFVGDRGRS